MTWKLHTLVLKKTTLSHVEEYQELTLHLRQELRNDYRYLWGRLREQDTHLPALNRLEVTCTDEELLILKLKFSTLV